MNHTIKIKDKVYKISDNYSLVIDEDQAFHDVFRVIEFISKLPKADRDEYLETIKKVCTKKKNEKI